MVKIWLALCFWFVSVCTFANGVVILQYHNVANDSPRATSISPVEFQQHLDYLADNQFNVLSLEQFMHHYRQQIPFPDKSVLITFDDGYQNIYDNAMPALKAKKFPFTVFVNVEPIVQRLPQFMDWKQLKELTKQGATIANHSYSHAHLIRQGNNESVAAWTARIKSEVEKAQQLLQQGLGTSVPKAFAYPYGEYNTALAQLMDKMGYLGFGQQSGATGLNSDHRFFPRFPFGGNFTDLDDFILKVNTLPLQLTKVRILTMQGQELADNVLPIAHQGVQLELTLAPEFQHLDVNCYLSGHGKLNKQVAGNTLRFYPSKPLAVGRDKFNCTAASPQPERFYWFSQLLIQRETDGSWYQE